MTAKPRASSLCTHEPPVAKQSFGALGLARRWARRGGAAALCAGFCLAPLAAHAADSSAVFGTLDGARQISAEPVTTQQKAVATHARLEDGPDRAKLTFELSDPVSASAFALADPDRIVVDLPEIDFQADPNVGTANKILLRHRSRNRRPAHYAGLVASFRFGFFTAGRSRIVIDLAGPARVIRAASEKSSDGKTLLVVELAKAEQAQFRANAQKAAEAAMHSLPPAAASPPVVQAQEAALPVVVIDAGHGGVDCGASNNGLVEKNLVFDFAKALQKKLAATGRFKVVMTRDGDVFVPLAERVRIARDSNAQLFVSIHADTLVDAAGVSGATFYTASERASDAEAARTAEKENQADLAAGLERQDESSGVSDILFDLTRRETRAYSHVFARTLVNYWKVAGRLNKNPERSAGFRVLKAPDVPSVLVELGYLSSEKDVTSFNSPEWRDQTSAKITEAIEAFFNARGKETHAETASPQLTPALADVSNGGNDLKLRHGAEADVTGKPH